MVVESIKDVPQGVPQGVSQKENVPQDIKRIIIEQIKINSKITTEELAEIVGMTSKTVKRYISKIDNVKFAGSGYSGHWEIIDKK